MERVGRGGELCPSPRGRVKACKTTASDCPWDPSLGWGRGSRVRNMRGEADKVDDQGLRCWAEGWWEAPSCHRDKEQRTRGGARRRLEDQAEAGGGLGAGAEE